MSEVKGDWIYEEEEGDSEGIELCGLEGCPFRGSKSVLEEHILYLHATGLYNRLNRGNNDPKEVEAWRNQRRKKYPTVSICETRSRLRKNHLEQFESIKKARSDEYERYITSLSNNSKRSHSTRKKNCRNRKTRDAQKSVRQNENFLDDEEDPPGWNGPLLAFRGIGDFSESDEETQAEDKVKEFCDMSFDISDDDEDILMSMKQRPIDEPPQEIKINKSCAPAYLATPIREDNSLGTFHKENFGVNNENKPNESNRGSKKSDKRMYLLLKEEQSLNSSPLLKEDDDEGPSEEIRTKKEVDDEGPPEEISSKKEVDNEGPPEEIRTKKEVDDEGPPEEISSKKKEDDEGPPEEIRTEKEEDDEGPPEEIRPKKEKDDFIYCQKEMQHHKKKTNYQGVQSHVRNKVMSSPYEIEPPVLSGAKFVRKKDKKSTLLEILLLNEIKKEKSLLLQSVRYVCENNFFLKS